MFDADAGTFVSGPNTNTYTITARDAGDITGGVNAAINVLGMEDLKQPYTDFSIRRSIAAGSGAHSAPPSRSEDAEFTLPLPSKAGGKFGQAAVYNGAVEYDSSAEEWSVSDDRFRTAEALYLANQDIWISQWGGEFYQNSGVPGEVDAPKTKSTFQEPQEPRPRQPKPRRPPVRRVHRRSATGSRGLYCLS